MEDAASQLLDQSKFLFNAAAGGEMDQSSILLDVSRIEVVRFDDPRFGDVHHSVKAQTKLQKDKIQQALMLNKQMKGSEESKQVDIVVLAEKAKLIKVEGHGGGCEDHNYD